MSLRPSLQSLHFCIVRFPGTNRELDLERALTMLGEVETCEVKTTIIDSEEESFPTGIDGIFLCGGFAWGDYLRAGACAAHARIIPSLKRHASKGTLIIGICNGLQILTEIGLLEGALLRNLSGRFICRWQALDFSLSTSTSASERLLLPIAHSDGRYVADAATLEQLEDEGRIFLRYSTSSSNLSPNGSMRDIAGICDYDRRVFGLMPHPENAIEAFHTSRDGLRLLRGLLAYALPDEARIAA